ncbi:hypothetical protein CDAR_394111 [Caerostris darwini]|uniref:Uncharacterized protein n=1 Tax=Caerostris darwini TaxID=1538125 RepID=A0AAV4REJ9_9ARAC|nr:hypothetical protein CDAR_394111 [Caerostris darwini]
MSFSPFSVPDLLDRIRNGRRYLRPDVSLDVFQSDYKGDILGSSGCSKETSRTRHTFRPNGPPTRQLTNTWTQVPREWTHIPFASYPLAKDGSKLTLTPISYNRKVSVSLKGRDPVEPNSFK